MITILILALLSQPVTEPSTSVSSADVEDLGVITGAVGFYLNQDPKRTDHHHFILEIFPQEWPTNKVSIVTTNNAVSLDDLVAVPHGKAIMAVRNVCTDGTQAPIKLCTFDLRRDGPEPVQVNRAYIFKGPRGTNRWQTAEAFIESRRRRQTNAAPPVPGQSSLKSRQSVPIPGDTTVLTNEVTDPGPYILDTTTLTNKPKSSIVFPGPLPGGKPKTYSMHMDEMRKFYAERQQSRRNQ